MSFILWWVFLIVILFTFPHPVPHWLVVVSISQSSIQQSYGSYIFYRDRSISRLHLHYARHALWNKSLPIKWWGLFLSLLGQVYMVWGSIDTTRRLHYFSSPKLNFSRNYFLYVFECSFIWSRNFVWKWKMDTIIRRSSEQGTLKLYTKRYPCIIRILEKLSFAKRDITSGRQGIR